MKKIKISLCDLANDLNGIDNKRTDCFHFFTYMLSGFMKKYIDKKGKNISSYSFRVESSLSHLD